MTNPLDIIKTIKNEIEKTAGEVEARILKAVQIVLLREAVLSELSRLVTLDTERGKVYLKMIAYLESGGSGPIQRSDASPTTPPPQRPPDTTP